MFEGFQIEYYACVCPGFYFKNLNQYKTEQIDQY